MRPVLISSKRYRWRPRWSIDETFLEATVLMWIIVSVVAVFQIAGAVMK